MTTDDKSICRKWLSKNYTTFVNYMIYNVGLIRFGLSGRNFFAPFIHAHQVFNLSYIVSSQNNKGIYPQAEVLDSMDTLVQKKDLDLIIIASPNHTHYPYTIQSLEAGKHVIIEKPFTVISTEAIALKQLAIERNLLLAPFQNRRWDSDFLTLKKIIDSHKLVELLKFESHFDRYRPQETHVE